MDHFSLYIKYQNLTTFDFPVRSFTDKAYDEDTPLHMAAFLGYIEDLEFMLRHINLDNININGDIGNTPLLSAINGKQNDCVRLLLSYGADPYAANDYGDTGFDWAEDKEEILQIFQDFGFEKPN